MKLSSLIEQVRKEKPNSFSPEHLTIFVTEVENMVQDHLKVAASSFVKYDWSTDGSKDLIVKPPYDALYKSYLKAKIDYSNEEYESYANNQSQFNSDFGDWKAYAMRSGQVESETVYIKNWW